MLTHTIAEERFHELDGAVTRIGLLCRGGWIRPEYRIGRIREALDQARKARMPHVFVCWGERSEPTPHVSITTFTVKVSIEEAWQFFAHGVDRDGRIDLLGSAIDRAEEERLAPKPEYIPDVRDGT